MPEKKFSIASFLLGLVVGLIGTGVIVIIIVISIVQHIQSVGLENSSLVQNIVTMAGGESMMSGQRETKVTGTITDISDREIKLDVETEGGMILYTLYYDADTEFSATPAGSRSEVDIRPSDLRVGDTVLVEIDEYTYDENGLSRVVSAQKK